MKKGLLPLLLQIWKDRYKFKDQILFKK